jgi:hypothetical protein
LYSDTGYENEICYVSADYYDLGDLFNRVKFLRLARAMSCLNCYEEPKEELGCRINECKARELHGVDTGEKRFAL